MCIFLFFISVFYNFFVFSILFYDKNVLFFYIKTSTILLFYFRSSFLKNPPISMSIGYISNLPNIIEKDSTILVKLENPEKLDIGPTLSNPGPILLNVADTAENAVIKLSLSRLTISSNATNTIIYMTK